MSQVKSFGSSFAAALRQRCPKCHQGSVFSGQFRMNEYCPQCGLRFDMYFSYALSIPILGLLILAGHLLLPDWAIEAIIGLAALAYIPFMPFVFRYSRVFWIYFERWANPNF
ncbi:MAG TPA: hypothetical protein VKU02_10510 [Gemmataceae bacterium]|nr:hypothetical protein [Gemmataceae bacterium]